MRFAAIFTAAFIIVQFRTAGADVTITPQGRVAFGKKITLEWRHNPAWQPIVFDGQPVQQNNTISLSGQRFFTEQLGAKADFALTRHTTSV